MDTSESRTRLTRGATVPATDPWTIGELARRTGLTVRALHHYDAIGLLVPSHRTAAGHRRYGHADVARLQQIQSLRALGLALDAVRRLLDERTLSPRAVIDLHLARLRAQLAAQTRLADRLAALAHRLDRAEDVSTDALCHIIEDMHAMDSHFTPEQLDTLRERRAIVGEARIRQVQDEWAEIVPAVRDAMARGVDPTTPEILAIARRWQGLVREFTGGDPAIARAVQTLYAQESAALQARHGKAVPTPEMFAYMARAFAAL